MSYAPRVLILGSTGGLGQLLSGVFRSAGWSVLEASRKSQCSDDSVRLDLCDADALDAAMSRANITINTVPDTFLPEQTALMNGHQLMRMAISPISKNTVFRNSSVGLSKGTVIMNAGLNPGITSLVLADLVAADPRQKGKISLALPLPWKAYHGAAGVRLVHEYLTTCGRHGSYFGRHETQEIQFPEPIGKQQCIGWAERESAWAPSLVEGRVIRTYCFIDSPRLNKLVLLLNKQGMLQSLPLRPFLTFKSRPKEPICEPMMIPISLDMNGEVLTRVIRCEGMYFTAARVAEKLATHFVNDPSLVGRGLLDVHEGFKLAEIAPQLEADNILSIETGLVATR